MARSRRIGRVSADRLQIVPAEELASPITDLASQIYTYSRMEAQLWGGRRVGLTVGLSFERLVVLWFKASSLHCIVQIVSL